MDKNSIDRKKLKYNFLKKIIIRFDYDGMDDTELDQVISSISMELKKHDYTSRTVETEKEMQFEFNDPESGDYAELYGKKIREQKVFVFHNENPQIKLSISSSCACISIEETKYVDCLKHCDVLWKVMSIIISEPEQVPHTRSPPALVNQSLQLINLLFRKLFTHGEGREELRQ